MLSGSHERATGPECRCGGIWNGECGEVAANPTATTDMEQGRVHDLRNRHWGHGIEFLRRRDDGSWSACIFLSAQVKPGDVVLAQGHNGDLRYRVRGEVRRPMAPGDQHFANLVFEPEVSDLAEKAGTEPGHEHCPDCGCDPQDHTEHAVGCPRQRMVASRRD